MQRAAVARLRFLPPATSETVAVMAGVAEGQRQSVIFPDNLFSEPRSAPMPGLADICYVEDPQPAFTDRRAKVSLECNGEPYDQRAVHVLGTSDVVHGIEFVQFVCPRCGAPHQSLLFR